LILLKIFLAHFSGLPHLSLTRFWPIKDDVIINRNSSCLIQAVGRFVGYERYNTLTSSSVQACIEAKFVTKSYGKTVALDDVSFSIPCGERYALLGPNGAGKSTTLKLLVGLLRSDTGTIRISGYEPFSSDANAILGYL